MFVLMQSGGSLLAFVDPKVKRKLKNFELLGILKIMTLLTE